MRGPHNFQKDLGVLLRDARKAKGLKQSEVAKKLETTRVTVGNYEAGTTSLAFHRALILMDLLDIDIEGVRKLYQGKKFEEELSKQPEDVQVVLKKCIALARSKDDNTHKPLPGESEVSDNSNPAECDQEIPPLVF